MVCARITKEALVMTVGSSRSLRIAASALLLSGAAIVGTASAANAESACGEYSFGFDGTRLLNDGISDSAGPYTISLPAGTYDITMHSFDDHVDHPGQVEQTQEQWYFMLDSGYTSPASSDIPDESTSTVDTFEGVIIGESKAISVHHLGQGGVNSVGPTCVGFTTVVTPLPVVEPEIEVAGPVLPVKEVIEPPVQVVVEPPVKEVVDVPVEVKPAVEVKAPPVVAAAPTPAPAPQLAVTGPSAHTWVMVLSGAALVCLGAALLLEDRRRSLRF